MTNFPCMKCHQNITPTFSMPTNVGPHKVKFKHMKKIKSCYQCHDQKNLNQLHYITGDKLSFDESHKLCLQCHGDKSKDFYLGIHGKQIGSWKEKKHRLTCVECHDPHTPKFPQWKADPPPLNTQQKKRHSL